MIHIRMQLLLVWLLLMLRIRVWLVVLDIVPKTFDISFDKNIYFRTEKLRYFDNSFDNSINDNDMIK